MTNENIDLASDILEPLVDKHGLLHIITALEIMCSEKSAHIESAWQDRELVKRWDKATMILGLAARKIEGLDI